MMPLSFLASGFRHRRLILRLTRSRIAARYRSSLLGPLWLFLVPLLMLAVYTFVFARVFEARWGAPGWGDAPFALVLFCGLTLYGLVAECLTEAPTLLTSYQSHIKQLVFPSEILAWVCLLTSGVRLCASLVLLVVAYVVTVGPLPESAIAAPLSLVPIALLTLGAVWIFASLGVYLRDLSHATGVITSALLFLSPIFYPASRVPEAFRPWLALNPLAPALEAARGALFEGVLPDWYALGIATGIGLLFAWVGYAWFMWTKEGFNDVL